MPRRHVLAVAGAAALLPPDLAFASSGARRVASLDWGVSETLYAMNIPVAGAADNAGYAKVIGQPATPRATVNLGLWSAPNIELLQALQPELVFIQNWQQALLPLLRRICQVQAVTIYTRQGSAYAHACAATRAIARSVGQADAGEVLIARGEAALAQSRAGLHAQQGMKIIVVMIIDGRGFIAFGRTSMFHDILGQLGLVNVWMAAPQLLCGASAIDLPALVSCPASYVVVIDPPGPPSGQDFYQSRLWAELPFVKERRVVRLPSLWEFGGLPTGYRFGGLLGNALLEAA